MTNDRAETEETPRTSPNRIPKFQDVNPDTHVFQCKYHFIAHFTSIDYLAQKKKKVDVTSFMPKEWALPKELNFLSQVHLPTSDSPAINLCDSIIRKANMLN